MPIYDFTCRNCGTRFESVCAHDAPPPRCLACGAPTDRLPSAPALHGGMARGREEAMRSLQRGTGHCPACAAGRPHHHDR